MHKTPKVIDIIVKNELCIGCGICVYSCPSNALKMTWNENGLIIPEQISECSLEGNCLSVCPFNPWPDKEIRTENEIADIFLTNTEQKHPKIGHYNNIYAGYSKQFRLEGSSGGIATYILTKLLDLGIVDHVISVRESKKQNNYYEYTISHSKEELLKTSKTKYYPVTLGDVMPKVKELKGKVAIVGVGCFIKAIRLAQYKEPELKEKIPFLVGIICGGVKSKFFTEYLSEKAGVTISNIQQPKYRIKDLNSTAGDYSFGCYNKSDGQLKTIKMREIGDMWGTGMFKANACDFCDDVTTELADISLGDAWINPYFKDGKGTNILVTRSSLAQNLINQGIQTGELVLNELPLETFMDSQKGSFNHRHIGLGTRVKMAKKRTQLVPPKRFENEKITLDFRLVQYVRMIVRKRSLEIWKENKNIHVFDKKMKKYLSLLSFVTRIYHYKKSAINRIKSKL